jgi:hypothetical protein
LRFVAEQRHVYGVKGLCRVLGISRSGFYAWLGRSPSARSVSDTELAGMIVEIHQRSRCTYGAPGCMPSWLGSGGAVAASGSLA